MSQTMPSCEASMIKVNGVGAKKMRLYGSQFLNLINDFKNYKSNVDS
jgi:superfamily II DNA helicase RecQ